MHYKELLNILLSNNAIEIIKKNEEAIFSIIPELKMCKGFKQQNEWHIYDVYDHILHVIDNVPSNKFLRVAALFHDLGKPRVFKLDEKGVGHFYGHWEESLKIFEEFAKNNHINENFIRVVSILIYYHDISLDKLDDETIIRIGKDNIRLLYILKRADLLAQNPKFNYLLEEYDNQEKRSLERIKLISKKKLYDLLTSDNIRENINDNIDFLFDIIPELKSIVGFNQNHPHHHLNVWDHTLLALELSNNDYDIRLALLLHDIGKPFSYQDEEVRHFHGHAEVSAEMTERILYRLGYPRDYVDKITKLVRLHDTKITKDDIEKDWEFSLKRLIVQECDSMAHNPDYQQKRLQYIEETKKLFKQYVKA